MKNITRFTAAVLSGLMLSSLAACSLNGEDKKVSSVSDQQVSAQTESPKAERKDEASVSPSPSQSSTATDDMGRKTAPGSDEMQSLMDHVHEMISDNASYNAVYNYLVVDNNVANDVAVTWINGLDTDWQEVAYNRYVELAKQNPSWTTLDIQDQMGSKDGFTPDQIVKAADQAVKNGTAPKKSSSR